MPGGLLLGFYGRGSSLEYAELLFSDGVRPAPAAPSVRIAVALVDDPESVAGGHRIWAIPKQLAQFSWNEHDSARVAQAEVRWAAEVLRVSVTRFGPRCLLPVLGRFSGYDPGRAAWVRGFITARPARVTIELAPDGQLSALQPRFSPVGLCGFARLRVAGPNQASPERS